jgi:protein-tyrosine phosphatase
MIQVLFVCHGNICRSPMAEFIMRDLLHRNGADGDFTVESAAASTEEIGHDMYPAARDELRRRGVPFQKRHARQITPADYARFDIIAVMDRQNLRDVRRLLGGDPQQKVRLLLEFAGESRDIHDPWYTRDFAAAYDDILRGCTALLGKLTDASSAPCR